MAGPAGMPALPAALEAEPDAPPDRVEGDDAELLDIADLEDLHRVADEAVGHLGDVDEGALLDADLDEGAEVDDVLDLARHFHALGEVLELDHALLEDGLGEAVAGVAVRALELGHDVAQGGVADPVLLLEGLAGLGVRLAPRAHEGEELLGQGVVLGVDPAVVEGVRALGDLEEARALLEGLVAHAGDLAELGAGGYGALRLAVLHDLLRGAGVDAGHVLEEGVARGVQVDADVVDHRADDLVEAVGKALLVDVVLVEAHPDGLGVDLHELSEGVLEAAADRDGAADGQVELGELLAGGVARRVDRGPVLVDDGEFAAEGVLGYGLGDDLLHLVARGAVADGDELQVVLLHRGGDRLPRLVGLLLLEDHEVVEELAGLVEGGALRARADAGVDAEDAGALDRRLHEEVLEVGGEDRDAVAVGLVGGLGADLAEDRRPEEAARPVVDSLAVVAIEGRGPLLEEGRGAVLVHIEVHLELALPLAAVHREDAVRLEGVERLRVVPVHLVGGRGLLRLVADALHHELPARDVVALDRGAVVGVLGDPLGDDVHGALDGLSGVGHGELGLVGALADELRRCLVDRLLALAEHDLGQGLEPLLLGDHAPGLLLLLEGQPDVLDGGEGLGLADVLVEHLGELAQGEDAPDDLEPALLEPLVGLVLVRRVPDLDLVEAARALLAVAADEGDGAALGDEGYDRRHLGCPDAELGGDAVHDGHLVDLELIDEGLGQFHGGYGTDSSPKNQAWGQTPPDRGQTPSSRGLTPAGQANVPPRAFVV